MILVDKLLDYIKTRDRKILITTDLQISDRDLSVVVIEILSWLRLEQKRTLWIAEGRKNCLKPLEIDVRYPWCANLSTLVDNEQLFHDTFSIKDGKFDFADTISEEDREMAREEVYQKYIPTKHVLYRTSYQSDFINFNGRREIHVNDDSFVIQKILSVDEINKLLDEFYDFWGYDIVPIAETDNEDYICLFFKENGKNPSVIYWNYELALEDSSEGITTLYDNVGDFLHDLMKA